MMMTYLRILAYQRHLDRQEALIRRRLSAVRIALAISVAVNLVTLIALTINHI